VCYTWHKENSENKKGDVTFAAHRQNNANVRRPTANWFP